MQLRSMSAGVVLMMLLGPLVTVTVVGQVRGSGGTVTEKPKPKAEEPTPKNKSAPLKIVTRYVEKPVTPTTGRLFVVAESGAVILVEPIKVLRGESQKGQVPDDQRGLVFNDLQPGSYRIAATLPGFHETEQTPIIINKNASRTVTLNFEPIIHSITFKANIDSGDLKYGKIGESPRVASLQNGSVTLPLPIGEYEAEVVPAEFGFATSKQKFTVTDNMVVEFKLLRTVVSTEPFSAKWSKDALQAWEMPAAWQAVSGSLAVKGAGVALLRNEGYSNYKDFKLTSTVKLLNGVGASFALRAKDTKNYYLLQLTGEKGEDPFTVRLFVVRSGSEKLIQPMSIPGEVAAAMKTGHFFTVVIRVQDNHIKVDIEDSETGAFYPLGILIDPNRTFPSGAVGIAARNSEETNVWRFVICTDCLKD